MDARAKTGRVVLCRCLGLVLLSACATTGGATKEDPSVAPGANERFATPEGRAASVDIFEAAERDEYQKPAEVIRNLELKEGDVVCEVGAGSGYFTPYLSKAVGKTGRVYAQDPQREFLELIRQKKERLGLANVEVVLGTYTDTNLPDNVCDVAFVLDTYHHFEWPTPMLDAMRRDLRQGGRLVIVDWYRRPNAVFDKLGINASDHMRLDLDGVVAEVTRNGWNHVETRTFLDYQFFAVFTGRQMSICISGCSTMSRAFAELLSTWPLGRSTTTQQSARCDNRRMDPSETPRSERPIGYWLKAADKAITARVDAAQRADGVSRLEWQVLNTISEATHRSPDQIVAALHIFLDRPALDTVLTALRDKGWIVADTSGEISLTEAGRQAHARILARQKEVRQQLMRGISADEYETVLRVLKRIVTNLGDPGAAQTS